MERFSAADRERMEQHVAKFAIPLVHQITGSDLLGTACVFAVNGKHYLVSAGHVLVSAEGASGGGWRTPWSNQAQATSLGDGLHVLPIDWDKFDFGVFRIDSSELIGSLRSAWRLIVPDDLGLLSDEVERFAFAGYPIGRREFRSELHGVLGRLTAVSPRYRKKPFEELEQRIALKYGSARSGDRFSA